MQSDLDLLTSWVFDLGYHEQVNAMQCLGGLISIWNVMGRGSTAVGVQQLHLGILSPFPSSPPQPSTCSDNIGQLLAHCPPHLATFDIFWPVLAGGPCSRVGMWAGGLGGRQCVCGGRRRYPRVVSTHPAPTQYPTTSDNVGA